MITVNKIDELLKYFHQELAYLRNKGGEFAERYPKIAGALELGPDGSTDPHVERLIESVAFLTARMQRDVQKKFPEYTQQILGGLYPHLVTPVPSITMAKFDADVTKINSPEGFLVPKETSLFLNDLEGCLWTLYIVVRTRLRTTMYNVHKQILKDDQMQIAIE